MIEPHPRAGRRTPLRLPEAPAGGAPLHLIPEEERGAGGSLVEQQERCDAYGQAGGQTDHGSEELLYGSVGVWEYGGGSDRHTPILPHSHTIPQRASRNRHENG